MIVSTEEFEKIYKQTYPLILRIGKRFSRSSNVPLVEFESQLSEELWISTQSLDRDKSSLNTYLSMRLRDRAIRIIKKKEGNYYRKVSTFKRYEDSDEDAPTSEISDGFILEDTVMRRRTKKKEADKRQLVDSLFEPAMIQNDPVMAATIDGIKRGETVNAIAKSLGLQRNTIDRKLQRLARNYNPRVHGDILDYFPDGVRIKREFITA